MNRMSPKKDPEYRRRPVSGVAEMSSWNHETLLKGKKGIKWPDR